jgi:dUTP pyrophosphatase
LTVSILWGSGRSARPTRRRNSSDELLPLPLPLPSGTGTGTGTETETETETGADADADAGGGARYDPPMHEPVTVRVRVLPHGEGLGLPAPASAGSAGADLRAAVDGEVTVAPGGRAAVPTGLVLEIPAGWEGQVRPRSGLAIRHGLTVVNAPGTIDSDYRGEVRVLLVNLGADEVTIRRGDRVAQLVLAPVVRAAFEIADELDPTARSTGGFGSTGR